MRSVQQRVRGAYAAALMREWAKGADDGTAKHIATQEADILRNALGHPDNLAFEMQLARSRNGEGDSNV